MWARGGVASQVERYVFFRACAERFGAGKAALLDAGRDEDAAQGMLAAALRVLLEVCALLRAMHGPLIDMVWCLCTGL